VVVVVAFDASWCMWCVDGGGGPSRACGNIVGRRAVVGGGGTMVTWRGLRGEGGHSRCRWLFQWPHSGGGVMVTW
jgi:hypothetical protein